MALEILWGSHVYGRYYLSVYVIATCNLLVNCSKINQLWPAMVCRKEFCSMVIELFSNIQVFIVSEGCIRSYTVTRIRILFVGGI